MTFDEIYDDHFRFVWRTLRGLGVHEAEVSDLVQEVFLIVHRRLAEFQGRSKITTWLYGICWRVASDWRRRAHVRQEVSTDSLDARIDDEQRGPSEAVEVGQARVLLKKAMDTMSTEQRAVFALYEIEDQTCEQVATLLEIPLGTVYSRLRLGREAFQKAIARLTARDAQWRDLREEEA